MILKITPIEIFFLYYSAGVATAVLLWNIYTELRKLLRGLKVRYSLANFEEVRGCFIMSLTKDTVKKNTNEILITLSNSGNKVAYIYDPPVLKYKTRKTFFRKRLLSLEYRVVHILYNNDYPIKILPGEKVSLFDMNPSIPLETLPFRIIVKDSVGRKYKSGKFYKIKTQK